MDDGARRLGGDGDFEGEVGDGEADEGTRVHFWGGGMRALRLECYCVWFAAI